MGWLSNILKIGGLVAAPFTGGASLAATGAGWLDKIAKIGGIAENVSGVLGEAAGSRAEAQHSAEQSQLLRDRANLDRSRLALAAPRERMSQMGLAMLMRNGPKAGGGGPMTLSSGRTITPMKFDTGYDRMFGPESTQLANMVAQGLLEDQKRGIPEIAGAPKSGIVDKLLGGAAFGTSLLGAATKPRRPIRRRPPVTTDMPGEAGVG